ncbi:MAG TPA: tryptophan 7-halogenase [Thermoanaerobaculia bacterium]|nr:tryptophan 7-halogenase [Thermoanaerobaculia bacterium]
MAIVGGGPAASAAALSLARRGIGSTIIERGDDSGDKPGESLPSSARPLLQALGISPDDHLPSAGNRSVWGGDGTDDMPSIFSPYGNGWHLDRRRFERVLAARAVAAGATRRCGTRVASVARNGRTWNLQLNDGTAVDCAFLIDATGRASWLSRRLGARRVHDDRLIAMVGFFDGGQCDATTLVEAAADGWWYSAPLPDSRLAVMLVSDMPRPWAPAPLTRTRIDEGDYRIVTPPRRVDAGSARLDRGCGDGWLAIGDAAMSFDPISSHGLLTALSTGLAAGETSIEDYESFLDTTWRAYARMRNACYASENRWADAPFWRRRRNVGEFPVTRCARRVETSL